MANSPPSKSHRAPRRRLSIFADLRRDLEFEARMILAWFWAPLKSGLESMLRFGLRSNITTTIMDRSPGQTTGDIFAPRRLHEGSDRELVSSSTPVPIHPAKRGPKRFLAARHGDE
jgi:hypothetical protein